MSKYLIAEIKDNRPVNKNHNLLVLDSPGIPETPSPGQFYMVGIEGTNDPLLKRPFSLFREGNGEIHFLYRIKGKGTGLLRQMEKGEKVSLLGPLGNGYPLPPKNITPLLIAGGIGIASLFPLAAKLSDSAILFYGGRTGDELLMLDELKGMVKELIISTDNGSAGKKGTVIDVLNIFLTSNSQLLTSNLLLYACGPSPMLEAVSRVASEKGIKGYISTEGNMACGVGACLSCAVNTKKGYKRVCKEGPVFAIEEIVW
ncbi:MAG: dihydroorotate dehydrogenase electron transfer subunit [Nitrospirae bacterium]|nr:MAG: dihydroorotate dehydrogenase electron transfer subunit [Nitrospirota bacterium]